MSLSRIAAPAVTPLTLEEAKSHLKVSGTDEDNLINLYIKAATDYIDGEWGFLGRCVVTQTWRLTLDAFPTAEIKIPLPPLQSIVQIAYDDTSGVEQIIADTDYFVDNQSEPGWVLPISSFAWPTPPDAVNSVRIDFVAGYDPSSDSPPDLTANVPFNIKAALLLIIGNFYANREENVVGVIASKIPFGAEILLRRHKFDLSMA